MFDSEQTVVWRLIFYKRKIKCGRNCGRTRVVTTRPIEKFGYFNQKEKGMIKEVSTPVVLTEAELDAVAAGVKQEGLVNVAVEDSLNDVNIGVNVQALTAHSSQTFRQI